MNTLINRACEAVYYDHPEKVELYMVYPCKYSYSSSNNKSVIALSARVDDSKFAAYDAQITSKLNSHANAVRTAGATSGFSGYNELRAHDYYCGSYNLTYDYECYKSERYFDYAHTAYGSLVEGSAVCDGYSAGFELILNRIGIPAMVGSTFTVPVTFNPAGTTNKGYTLTSSDTSVVSTNGTTAVALKRGAVILTIVSADGSYRASTSVWVRDPLYAKFGYGGNTYEVSSENSVELVKAGSVSNVVIPEYVYFSGKNYPVTKISNKAFKNNKSVTSVSGGKNIREIGYYAFSGCSKLKSVKLKGACIREIGYKAFYNCKKLSTIEFNGSKLSSIDEMAFKGINKKAKFRIKASKSKFNKVVKLVKGAGAKKATYKRG